MPHRIAVFSSAAPAQRRLGDYADSTLLRRVTADWPLFAVTDHFDPRNIDSLLDQIFLYAIGAMVAQPKVIFFTSALVTVAFDRESHVPVFF